MSDTDDAFRAWGRAVCAEMAAKGVQGEVIGCDDVPWWITGLRQSPDDVIRKGYGYYTVHFATPKEVKP